MWSHSAPPLIMRLHSAVSCPKSEASTEGEMMARGIVGESTETSGYTRSLLPSIPCPESSSIYFLSCHEAEIDAGPRQGELSNDI